MRNFINLLAISSMVASFAIVSVPSASAAPVGNSASKDGQACTVTGGANKGKTGTYDSEGGNSWCSGSWGSTQCNGSDKCKDGKAIVVKPPIFTAPQSALKTFSIAR